MKQKSNTEIYADEYILRKVNKHELRLKRASKIFRTQTDTDLMKLMEEKGML